MRIHHVITSFGIGGLENGLVNIINNVDAERFANEITCIGSSGCMAGRLTRRCPVDSLNKGNNPDHLLSLKLAAVFRRSRPDIVHARNWGTIDAVLGARLAGIRGIIHSEHGWEASDPTGSNRVRRMARRLLSTLVDAHVVVSEELRDWLIEIGIRKDKIFLIRNGVDTGKFCPGDRASLRERYRLPPDSFIICAVGRLNPVKDYSTLIRAMAFTGADTRLLLIGDGPLHGALQSQIDSLGLGERCTLLGDRNDVDSIMKLADVFVIPSIAEGMSNTLLEAMSSALPVVASDVTGNAALVKHQRTGLLFPAGNEKELAAQLNLLAKQKAVREKYGTAGMDVARAGYSAEAMILGYEEVYQRVMKGVGK